MPDILSREQLAAMVVLALSPTPTWKELTARFTQTFPKMLRG